jgi:NADH-quinone oxidoreductase subunit I
MTFSQYFSGLFKGLGSLFTGMRVTIREFFKKKITQQYPENRDTLVIPPRVRGNLTMPHDENNEHACTACGICQMNCPNGTIQVISEMQEIDGKKKRVLIDYFYDLGQCTFCNLCVLTCPSDAIKFSNEFENSVFTHSKLKEKLNYPGSKLREKKVAPKPAAPVAEKPVAKTEDKPAEKTEEKTAPVVVEDAAKTAKPSSPIKADEEMVTLEENKKTVEQIAIDDVKEEKKVEALEKEVEEKTESEAPVTEKKKEEPKEDKE